MSLLELPGWAVAAEAPGHSCGEASWIARYRDALASEDALEQFGLLSEAFDASQEMRPRLFVAASSRQIPHRFRIHDRFDRFLATDQLEKVTGLIAHQDLEVMDLPALLFLLAGAHEGTFAVKEFLVALEAICARSRELFLEGRSPLAIEMLGLALLKAMLMRWKKRNGISAEQLSFLREYRPEVEAVLTAMNEPADAEERAAGRHTVVDEMRSLLLPE